jgi:hypothetical protein
MCIIGQIILIYFGKDLNSKVRTHNTRYKKNAGIVGYSKVVARFNFYVN